MSIKTTVLFATPQAEIASLIADRISQSTATSIVTGFATPGGVDAIAAPIEANPRCITTIVVGAPNQVNREPHQKRERENDGKTVCQRGRD